MNKYIIIDDLKQQRKTNKDMVTYYKHKGQFISYLAYFQ